MRMAKAHWEELVAHARDEAPNECCGYLRAKDGLVDAVHRSENLRASPYGYELDAGSLLAANDLDDAGLRGRHLPLAPAQPGGALADGYQPRVTTRTGRT